MSSPEEQSDITDIPVKIVLSERDYKILLDALENPPAPNEALIKAMRRYTKDVTEE